MHRVRAEVVLLLSAAAMVAVVACGGASDHLAPAGAASERTRPVTVRAVMPLDPASLSLIGKPDKNSEIVATQITDSLVQYDSGMNLVPRIASAWTFSEDRRTLSFELRPGVRWHDGTPVTAEDVVFSVQQALRPELENFTFAPLLRDVETVEALGPSTVRARYRVATPDALEAWRLPIIPRHLAESGAELLTGQFARHPVGCGPFRFVRYAPGEEIVLEANEDYWDGRPAIDRLVFRIYPDQRTSFQALLAGDIDIMVVVPEMYHEALHSPAAARLAGLVYYRLHVWQVVWNLDGSNPFFTDPRVRQALMLALDRQSFSRNVVDGLARVAVTAYHPEQPWTDRTIEPLPYDPGRARILLDAAGWHDDDGDGVRERGGRPFAFTLTMYTASQELNDGIAAWLQQSWAEVGVRVELERLEWRQFRERRIAHQFQAVMGGIVLTTNPDIYELYHSGARDLMNYGGFADPEIDRLLELGRTTFDPVERLGVYHRLQHRLFELQPAAWLFHFPTPVLYDRRLVGLHPSPLGHWLTSDGPRLWHWDEAAAGRG